jgi:hypothetical protein
VFSNPEDRKRAHMVRTLFPYNDSCSLYGDAHSIAKRLKKDTTRLHMVFI